MGEIVQLVKQTASRSAYPHYIRQWVEPGYVFLLKHHPIRLEADRVDDQYQFNLIGFFSKCVVARPLPTNGYADLTAYTGHMVRLLAVEWHGESPTRCFIEAVNVNRFLRSKRH